MRVMRSLACASFLVIALAGCGGGGTHGSIDAVAAPYCAPTHGTNLKLTQVATGLTEPVFVTAPTGDPRLFILEKPGRIRLIGADHKLRDTAYLDLGDKVDEQGSEQGLLGLAFHPNFANNGKLYVFYTENPDGSEVIVEYTVDPAAEVVTGGSPRTLVTVTDPASNHNGGTLQFGPDGYLYYGIGDGGGGGDTYHNGQNKQTMMAKISRIDVDHPAAPAPYGIPAANPWT